MKRDMDLIRNILLKVEELDDPPLTKILSDIATDDDIKIMIEHLRLLIEEAGLITGIAAHTLMGSNWFSMKLTWKGHEYLDNIRDPEIWNKTKQGAQKVGSFSLDVMSGLAKGFIKKKISDHTGVEVDI